MKVTDSIITMLTYKDMAVVQQGTLHFSYVCILGHPLQQHDLNVCHMMCWFLYQWVH